MPTHTTSQAASPVGSRETPLRLRRYNPKPGSRRPSSGRFWSRAHRASCFHPSAERYERDHHIVLQLQQAVGGNFELGGLEEGAFDDELGEELDDDEEPAAT